MKRPSENDGNPNYPKHLKMQAETKNTPTQAIQNLFVGYIPAAIYHVKADGNCAINGIAGQLTSRGYYEAANAQEIRKEIYNFLQSWGPLSKMSQLRKGLVIPLINNFIFDNADEIKELQNITFIELEENEQEKLYEQFFKARFNRVPTSKQDYIYIDEFSIIASLFNIKITVLTCDKIVNADSHIHDHIYHPNSEVKGGYICNSKILIPTGEIILYTNSGYLHFERIEHLREPSTTENSYKVVPIIPCESDAINQELSLILSLKVAIKEGKAMELLDIFNRTRSNAELADIFNSEALLAHAISKNGSYEVVKRLCEMGVNHNIKMKGVTPLIKAQERLKTLSAKKEQTMEWEEDIKNCTQIIEFLEEKARSSAVTIRANCIEDESFFDFQEVTNQVKFSNSDSTKSTNECWGHIVQFCLQKSGNIAKMSKYQDRPYSLKNFYSLILDYTTLGNDINDKHNGITLSHVAAYFHNYEIMVSLRIYWDANFQACADEYASVAIYRERIFSQILSKCRGKDVYDMMEEEKNFSSSLRAETFKRYSRAKEERELYDSIKELAKRKDIQEISTVESSYHHNMQDNKQESINSSSAREEDEIIQYLPGVSLIDIIKLESFHGDVFPEEEKILAIRLSAGEGILNLTERDSDGNTPLHIAAKKNYSKVVESLIQYEADVNAINFDNVTPIFLAAKAGFAETVEIFLRYSSNVDLKIINTRDGNTFLHAAVYGGCEELVIKAVSLEHFDVNTKNNKGVAPLHLAVNNNKLEIVRILLAAGADVNQHVKYQGEEDKVPLHLAVKQKNIPMVELLLSRSEIRIEERDKDSKTPLIYALELKEEKIAKLLVDNNADLSKIHNLAIEYNWPWLNERLVKEQTSTPYSDLNILPNIKLENLNMKNNIDEQLLNTHEMLVLGDRDEQELH